MIQNPVVQGGGGSAETATVIWNKDEGLPFYVSIYYTDESFTPQTISVSGFQRAEFQAIKGSMVLVRGTEGLDGIGLDSGSVEEITDLHKSMTPNRDGYLYVGWVK